MRKCAWKVKNDCRKDLLSLGLQEVDQNLMLLGMAPSSCHVSRAIKTFNLRNSLLKIKKIFQICPLQLGIHDHFNKGNPWIYRHIPLPHRFCMSTTPMHPTYTQWRCRWLISYGHGSFTMDTGTEFIPPFFCNKHLILNIH